jgi:hypothetical protein
MVRAFGFFPYFPAGRICRNPYSLCVSDDTDDRRLLSRGSENKGKSTLNAIIFGLSIILIYTALGLIVSLTSAGAGFAILHTHWIPNILFFALFVIFAVSFLGAFE